MRIKAIVRVKLLDSTFLRLRRYVAFEILSANPVLLFVSTPIFFAQNILALAQNILYVNFTLKLKR